jgi:hypothetical protein
MTDDIVIDWQDTTDGWGTFRSLDDSHNLRIDLGHDSLSSIRSVAARKGQRCGSCRFLDRCEGGWECVSVLRSVAVYMPMLLKPSGVVTPEKRLLARLGWDGFEMPANPGWFACPLWLPGESMSTQAYRQGRFPEHLALQALAGDTEPRTEFRTRRDSDARLDAEALEEATARFGSWWQSRDWWKMLATASDLVDSFSSSLFRASVKAARAFGGLREIVTAGSALQPEHINCRCDVEWKDAMQQAVCDQLASGEGAFVEVGRGPVVADEEVQPEQSLPPT